MDANSSVEFTKILRKTTLFQGCGEKELEHLAGACRLRHQPKGSVVFFQSDPGDALYLVLSGSVAILLTNPDGRELVINEARSGEFFGEISLIVDQPRSASAVTREKSELLMIPAAAFQQVLASQTSVMRHLLGRLARQLSASSERESALAFLDAAGRVVRYLLQMDQENDEKGYMILSQAELAQRTGLSRQTVAKILGRWRRAGWLLTGRGRIMLMNRPALEKIAQ